MQSPSSGGSAQVRLGIKEEGRVSASSDKDYSTQHHPSQDMLLFSNATTRCIIISFIGLTGLTRELGSSGPYDMLFCLDDLDKKKHNDVINSLKNSFF